jgi:hypothetical protein
VAGADGGGRLHARPPKGGSSLSAASSSRPAPRGRSFWSVLGWRAACAKPCRVRGKRPTPLRR